MINNVAAYRRSFETIEKSKQVIMLYDTAISSLHQAKLSIEAGDFQERYNNIEKVFLIVSGLKGCLDHDAAPKLSGVLHDWYSSLEMKLLSVNSTNSAELCEECAAYLKKMRAAWVEVDNQLYTEANSDSSESESSSSSSSHMIKETKDEPIMAESYSSGFSLSA